MSFRPVKPREYMTTKWIVAQLLDAVGPKRAAETLGRGLSQTYGYADEEVHDANLTLEKARQLAAVGRSSVLAEAFAFDAGGFFMPVAPSDETLAELLAQEEAAHGAMMADLMRRVGVSRAIGGDPRLIADLDALISALVAARRKAAP